MTPPIIELKDVSFSFGGPITLERINLQINEGELIGVVGPNAGGKSTLLKIIMGYIPINSGNITIDNIPLNENNIDIIRQKFAYIGQNILLVKKI